jgi:hypothetical protein
MKIISLIFVNVIRRQDLEHGDLLECMWFELKTKFQSILININYRSVRQALSNICRNISHKIYVQITQTYNIAILVKSSC